MKCLLNTCKTILVLAITIHSIVSCSSSRQSQGFKYRTTVEAPDIGLGSQAIKLEYKAVRTNREIHENNIPSEEFRELKFPGDKVTGKLSGLEKEKMIKITEAVRNEYRQQLENGAPMTNRELVKKITETLVSNGTIDHLSNSGMKKLDRLAKKMDKKLLKQEKDIDVKNNTNLELFFLIMGIAGLVLGILGVWIGWLLLVVFGGLYLYYKLVKD